MTKEESNKINKKPFVCVEELRVILKDLVKEKKIFLNSSNKYEIITDGLFIGTLLRNSKGVSYVEINGEPHIAAASHCERSGDIGNYYDNNFRVFRIKK